MPVKSNKLRRTFTEGFWHDHADQAESEKNCRRELEAWIESVEPGAEISAR